MIVYRFSPGRPHLWARLDRKPNKQAEKRFKKYQHAHRSCKGTQLSAPIDDRDVSSVSPRAVVVLRFPVERRRGL